MLAVVGLVAGIGLIVWGAEQFAEHLAGAANRLGISAFALAVLLAGAEPEELATAIAAGVRDVPAVAFGDVIGANVAICLVALPAGAVVAPLPFPPRVRRYAVLGLPLGAGAAVFAWDGSVGRWEGAALVAAYGVYVGSIWARERRPPSLGETAELDQGARAQGRIGRDLVLVVVGTAAIVVGATLLVESVRGITGIEATQTRLSLTVVGFATAFELVVLAWSSARRGITEAVIAAVVGSYAYNATLTLGAAAVITPLGIDAAADLHLPLVVMVLALAAVIVAARRSGSIDRWAGVVLLAAYPPFVAGVLVA